ncbi:hypothetical protein J4E83_001192 [Alternaria metachromatica]|uniref:uncharacterized protein n=1 Tax=Alternaria metachromatica TaxID=283354 RepID=UPI0020C3FA7D|nr:uncharacterized protein J4E83_001192 [Alternaria metachromatica]KAI4636238.1 hypothetical protein J4E83_001192 [Alternaria metachromatica]
MAANDDTVRRDSVNSYTSGPKTPQGALGRYQTQSPHDPAMAFPLQAQLPTPKMSPQMMAQYMRSQAISTQSQPRPTTMQAQPPTREEAQARQNRQFALFGMAYFQRLDPQAKQQFQQLPSQKQNEIVRNAIEKRKQQEIHKARGQQMAAQQAKQQEAQQLAAQQLAAQQLAAQQLAAQQAQQQAKQQALRQAHFNNFAQQYVSSFSPEKLQRFRQGSGIQQMQHLSSVYQQMQNAQKLQQQKMQQMQQHQPARQLQQVSQPQQLAQQPQRILRTPEVQQHRQLQSPRILQAPQARQHQQSHVQRIQQAPQAQQHQEPPAQRIQQAPPAQQHQEPQTQRIQQTQPAPQLKRPRSDDDEASPAAKVAKVAQTITEQQPKNTEDPEDQRLRSKLTSWLASNEAMEEAQKSEQSAELHWQMQHAGPYAGPYAGYEPAKSNILDNSF